MQICCHIDNVKHKFLFVLFFNLLKDSFSKDFKNFSVQYSKMLFNFFYSLIYIFNFKQIPNPGFQQQQQLVTSVPTSISIPPVGVIQPIHHSPPARLTRSIASSSSSSLKRSNATAFPPNLEAVSSAMLTTINNTINVSSPPPLLYANSTQIRLATGEALNVAMRQRIDEFNESIFLIL